MNKDGSQKFKAGEIIICQGDSGDTAYLIKSGRVEITLKRIDGKIQTVGTRGPGTMIGEMAIVDNASRTATATALEDCELLEITKKDFVRRLQSADPVIRAAYRALLVRYRDVWTRAEISGENRNWPPVEMVEGNDPDQQLAIKTVNLETEFRKALQNDGLSLDYQPIVSLKTAKVVGFEALMRWIHPTKGPIAPDIFIPVAEENGDIVEASRWALREACHALKRIEGRAGYKNQLFMSVNFSSSDFASANFVDTICSIVRETEIPIELVHLEITERLALDKSDNNARATLEMCRRAGLGISIDDFGTGHATLKYLRKYPVDTLKIDRSFVRDLHKHENKKSLKIVESTVKLGKDLKLDVIAEGVEEKEEAEQLKELGCDMAQGYFFAKPMPEAEAAEFTREGPRFDL